MNGSELSEWWKSAQLKTVLNSHSCYRRIFSATLVLPMRHGVRGVMTSILYRFMQSRGYSKKVQLRQKSCVYTPPPPPPSKQNSSYATGCSALFRLCLGLLVPWKILQLSDHCVPYFGYLEYYAVFGVLRLNQKRVERCASKKPGAGLWVTSFQQGSSIEWDFCSDFLRRAAIGSMENCNTIVLEAGDTLWHFFSYLVNHCMFSLIGASSTAISNRASFFCLSGTISQLDWFRQLC